MVSVGVLTCLFSLCAAYIEEPKEFSVEIIEETIVQPTLIFETTLFQDVTSEDPFSSIFDSANENSFVTSTPKKIRLDLNYSDQSRTSEFMDTSSESPSNTSTTIHVILKRNADDKYYIKVGNSGSFNTFAASTAGESGNIAEIEVTS